MRIAIRGSQRLFMARLWHSTSQRRPAIGRKRRRRNMRVAGYMSRQPVTISARETLEQAREKMSERHCRRLPVVDGGILTGILSDRDLGPHTGHLAETRVTAAMTENPRTVTSATSMRDAARE